MRASSFSNAKVIDLLNSYFVAVHVRNQDCAEDGTAAPEEKAERDRIYREALKAGLPAGTVCAYLLTADGTPVDTAPLNQKLATNPQALAERMERLVKQQNVARGKPVVPPAKQSGPPAGEPGSLKLHVIARYLQRQGEEFVRNDTESVLGSSRGGNWGDLPSEDWIVLTRKEWQALLPESELHAKTSWELNRDVAGKLLQHFYPPTENTDLKKNRLDEVSVIATVESVQGGVARASLRGKLKMKHPFYHKDDKNFVETSLAGYVEIDVANRTFRNIRLVTDGATYGGEGGGRHHFGAALKSVADAE